MLTCDDLMREYGYVSLPTRIVGFSEIAQGLTVYSGYLSTQYYITIGIQYGRVLPPPIVTSQKLVQLLTRYDSSIKYIMVTDEETYMSSPVMHEYQED